ncbi:HDIG domain-containing metalloprotein [Clostridium ljungdahlii]|uniref:Multifunctional CCA protein n=1 Tax=Clostridium ljungdahlii TaxID=1538 RepID=A0A162J7D9_9CLOT|nr:HDIG domain-containing metalloprotein [Clostridium ljungdahlii]OAA91395.1 Multifunctional CCA protein [Clostridium ljungdahlii]
MMNLNRLYLNIEYHLLNDSKPSDYLKELYNDPLFQQYPFDMLYKLNITKQSPKYHPEGTVWNHTLLVVDEAANVKSKSKNQKVFMWAALLHDIGKPSTTKDRNGKITSYEHDKVGAALSKEFLLFFTEDTNFIEEVCELIKYHMQILFVVNNLPFADIQGMKEHTDIHEVALLGLCDRIGRLNSDRKKEQHTINQFLKKCK